MILNVFYLFLLLFIDFLHLVVQKNHQKRTEVGPKSDRSFRWPHVTIHDNGGAWFIQFHGFSMISVQMLMKMLCILVQCSIICMEICYKSLAEMSCICAGAKEDRSRTEVGPSFCFKLLKFFKNMFFCKFH